MQNKVKFISTNMVLFVVLLLVITGRVHADDLLYANDMRVNQLEEAYGIPADSLNFSWTVQSGRDNTIQTAYRIVIAKTAEQMMAAQNGETAFWYDSGWQISNKNIQVGTDAIFEENSVYYWCVQIQDNYERTSSYSEIKAFSTAVGTCWNSKNGIWTDSSDFVFLRWQKTIDMDHVDKVLMSVTATSPEDSKQYVYNLYINEQCVGIGPARIHDGVLYYNTYDITEHMISGENVIGAICYSESGHAFLGQMTVYYQDGTQEIIMNTDTHASEWLALRGDAAFGNDGTSVGTIYYTQAAENINSLVYPHGWLRAEYEAEDWAEVTISADPSAYQLAPYISENIRYYEVFPESVTLLPDGSYLFDFGREIIGNISLHIDSSIQQNIAVHYGERLNSAGSVQYKLDAGNVYEETWVLKAGRQDISGMNMKTFRYIQISGCVDDMTLETISARQVRQAFAETDSSFCCSNKILNDEYEISKYTIQTTSQDLYVDTQSRERETYAGDLLITMMSAFSMERDYTLTKYSLEYALDNPTWPTEYLLYLVQAFWEYYLYSGDDEFLQENYSELIACMQLFSVEATGLVPLTFGSVMVDWPAVERDGYDMKNAYYNTVLNAIYVGACQSMANISECLGYVEERELYQDLSHTVKENMISKLYNSEKNRYADGLTEQGEQISHYAQQATVFALAYGIYEDQQMADHLADSIRKDGLNQTSVYATYFMLQGLYNSNHGILARQIMSDPSEYEGCHTWANMMYRTAATITTEAWDASLKANMSFSHPWGSAPGSWLIRGLFGIKPTSAGFRSFDMKLQPGGIQEASVKVPTMQGRIEASYCLNEDGTITAKVDIPANGTARILIPTEDVTNQDLMIDGLMTVAAVVENRYLSVQLGSGSHTIIGGSGNRADNTEMPQNENVVYRTYQSSWNSWETNGNTSGTINDTEGLQRLQIYLNSDIDGGIRYSVHLSSYGWRDWVYDGNADTVINKDIQAIKIELTGAAAEKWDLYYRVYNQSSGWMGWTCNGAPAGTEGLSEAIKAIEVQLVEKGQGAPGETKVPFRDKSVLTYSVHCQKYGWMDPVCEGELAGTENEQKRLEAIRISVNAESLECSGGISYRVHRQTYGWTDWMTDGEDAGTTGEAKRLEAIDIKLTGELAEHYDIYYRVHCQSYGWLDWAKNGESAGTAGLAKRLEAIEILLVKKDGAAPGITSRPNIGISNRISYTTHVQTYGWLERKYDGQMSGTEGQAKRLEAICMKLETSDVPGGVTYRTHMQSYGWSNWVSDDAISGVIGKAKRMEAVQIQLTGEIAEKYDIYYRVHCQSFGWMDWVKNGELAGTTGLGKRLEGIEIKMEPK